jgi:short-subunit dehydrogenase
MLAQASEGHIVNTASVAGLLCPPLSAPYVASKHAVVGLSECLYHDLNLADSQIGVSVLCPGFVKTRIVDSERVRPDDLKDPVAASDAFANEVAAYYKDAVEAGSDPSSVADAVVEAILSKRFYVLTHPQMDRAIKQRFDGILDRANPQTRSLAEMSGEDGGEAS